MAEVFDFGLQQHKIKMDGGFSNNGLFAVVGDTARRLEVQLLDANGNVQNATGINLRLNAEVAGKLTFVDASIKDATKGIYAVDLASGMFLEPGNWAFQWQVTKGTNKISSFPFAVKIGGNISEGGSQATNFYFNVEELRLKTVELENRYQAMINSTTDKDVISAPEIIAARKGEASLNARLTKNEQETTAQFQQTDYKKADVAYVDQQISAMTGGAIKGTYTTLIALKTAYPNGANGPFQIEENNNRYIWDVNKSAWVSIGPYEPAEIADGSIDTKQIADEAVTPTQTSFIEVQKLNNLMLTKDYANGYVLNNTGSAESDVARFTVKSPITVTAGEPYIFSKSGVGVIVDKIVFKTTNIYNDHEGYISNTVNVLSGKYVTPPTNAIYMFVTFYMSATGWTNTEVELFLSDLVVEKSTMITPIEPDKLMNVTVPYLDNEIELLKSSGGSAYDATNKINDYTSLTGQVANTVGWTEPNESYNTLAKGIPVTPGKEYSATIEGFPLTMQFVVFKTADDISFYEASTFLNRTTNKMSVIAPENAKFMFLSMGNTTDLSNVIIQESPYPISQVEPILKGFTYPNTSLYGANMMTLGDSLSEEGIWQSYVMSKLGIASLTNLAIGGKKSSEFADNVTADNMANIDIVTVMGFFNSTTSPAGTVNDVASNAGTDSICANYKYIIQKLYGFNKKVKIVLITPHRPSTNDVVDKAEAVKAIALYYGIPCIDLYNTAGFNEHTYSEYLRDDVHSSYGYKGGYNREAEVITGGLIHYYG